MKYIKNFLIWVIIIFEINNFLRWLTCNNFVDKFYFSKFNEVLRTNDLIYIDAGQKVFITKLFYNKFTTIFRDVFREYFWFWDFRFLLPFVSIVGIAGILLTIWYIVNSRSKKIIVLLFLTLIIPLGEVFLYTQVPFIYRLGLLFGIYINLSLYGIYNFLKTPTRFRLILIVILIVLSIWVYLGLPTELYNYCTKI